MNWETILGIVTHPIVITVVTTIAGFAIKGFVKYKKAFTELVDIPRTVLKSRDETSPGGKKITEEEYAKIGKEIVEFAEAAGTLYTERKKRK